MSQLLASPPAIENLADLLDRLGGIDPSRVRYKPAPGTATEQDVIAARRSRQRRLCELVDGVLVEKTMGAKESFLAAVLIRLMGNFVDAMGLGIVLGADGALQLLPG